MNYNYTEMNSKFGNLAKPAPQIWSSAAAPKQLNLNKLSDAGGSKDADVRRSQKPNFEFISVYTCSTIIFVFLSFLNVFCSAEEKSFVVVIPSYNNEDWYLINLDSVFQQKYQNYRVIYIDDHSTDGTSQLVEDYVKEHDQEHRFTLIKNKGKNGPLACMCQAIGLCNKQEIVVDLDGNDWLAHEGVLSFLNEIYSSSDTWMTYGQLVFYPRYAPGFASQIPQEVIERNLFRSYGGAVTHLRTFYAGLFQAIAKDDFLYEGSFIRKAGDLAYSIPISEMAGWRIRFIPKTLYVYNQTYPLNDNKCPDSSEDEMDWFLREKERYSPLEEFPHLPFPLYDAIHDLLHPTFQDYRLIQNFLSDGERENIERLRDMETQARNMTIIGKTPDTFPQSGSIAVNCDSNDKENCVILFAPFNRSYSEDLKRLLKWIGNSDYKGHVLYRLGGWPNTEGGSLSLAHVPCAFKPCLFKEAQRLRFKRILWLDPSVVPLVSLNDIFAAIEQEGHFVLDHDHSIGSYMTPEAAAFFGLNHHQTHEIPSCFSGIFGLDLTNDTSRKVLDFWYQAAQDRDAYFTSRPDQNALSIILYQLGISDFISLERIALSDEEIQPDSLFLLEMDLN